MTEAVEAARRMPALPADCREAELSGVVVGDRLDVALYKTDLALWSANERVARCAAWYDATRPTPRAGNE